MKIFLPNALVLLAPLSLAWAEGALPVLDYALPVLDYASPHAPLAARFSNPPAQDRILKIVHVYPEGATEQDALLAKLSAQGFGGMATNVSFHGYIEDADKVEAFARWVAAAREIGMALWLYDERGYPSGSAYGITLRDHPELEAWGLYETSARTSGGPVTLDMPPGQLVLASAFQSGRPLDLSAAVDLSSAIRDGKLAWEAPTGQWHVMVITHGRLYDGTHAQLSLADKLPYINLLMPEPTARYLEVNHDAYANRLGDLGRYFISTFTDEPSLMSMFLAKQPWRVLPWSKNLPVEFEKRRGYPLLPVLPALFEDAGPQTKRARYDFWLTVGELVSENYFGQIQAWCDRHNILSGGHLLYEEPLLKHVPLYGDFFRCARRLSAPSIDCLTSIPSEVPWYVARLISSVAELENRPVTMCETSDHVQRWRPKGDDRPARPVSEDEIRGTCNRLIANGITTITSYYSFGGLSDEQLRRLNTWIGRCATMLAGGQQVTDIALVYPAETLWPRFTPAHYLVEDAPWDAHKVERVYRTASELLYRAGRDFTYIDSRTLCDGVVDNGTLTYNGRGWRVIILPCVDTLPMKAWENLAAFHRGGGVVIALADRPANSETEFPSAGVGEIAASLFPGELSIASSPAGGAAVYLSPGSETMLPSVLDNLIAPDVRVTGQNSPIRSTHRRIDGREVFFLINDSETEWRGAVTFAAAGEGERWDPETGAMTPVASPQDLDVQLGPYGGVFYRFAQARPPDRRDASSFPQPAPVPMPEVEPAAAHGQFVHATVNHVSKNEWKALGRITKSDVDAFLFLAFSHQAPVDISGARAIAFTVQTPPGQTATPSLLVILRDKNGCEYFADTGYPLRGEGTHRCAVPIALFEHAGFSQGPEGPLDFTAVSTISIGWGGYRGVEGETIEFTLQDLQTFH